MTRAQFESAMAVAEDRACLDLYRSSSVDLDPYAGAPPSVNHAIYDAWNLDEERHAL